MFDITIFVEKWWLLISAFLGILAMITIYVFYRRRKNISIKVI